jgi:hypothetical protein
LTISAWRILADFPSSSSGFEKIYLATLACFAVGSQAGADLLLLLVGELI